MGGIGSRCRDGSGGDAGTDPGADAGTDPGPIRPREGLWGGAGGDQWALCVLWGWAVRPNIRVLLDFTHPTRV